LKKPLASLLIASAAVAALAVPAGASTSAIWTHQTLTCQGGRHATVTYKWQGAVAVDSWVDNRCRHQYLTVVYCDNPDGDSPKCGATDVAPRTKVHLGPLNYRDWAFLAAEPTCGFDPNDNGCEY
jgi:hypothetical protein